MAGLGRSGRGTPGSGSVRRADPEWPGGRRLGVQNRVTLEPLPDTGPARPVLPEHAQIGLQHQDEVEAGVGGDERPQVAPGDEVHEAEDGAHDRGHEDPP